MSEAEQKYREKLAKQVDSMTLWLGHLSGHLKDKPDDVVPGFVVTQIAEAANGISYEAGMVNGAHMQRYDRSDTVQQQPKP